MLFAACYFPKSYSNLFRKFVVPIEHYKEKDLEKIGTTTWSLDGPFGGIFSGNGVDKAKVIYAANDALTNNVHSSFFAESLKDAIDCFPEYFKYRVGADLQALEGSDISPDWDKALSFGGKEVDCNLPIMVCGLWSYWCPRRALEKYLSFVEACELLSDPPDSKAVIIARAHKSLAYSAFLSAGSIAHRSSGKYRDIFARLTAFCQLSIPEYTGQSSRSFKDEHGERVFWQFKAGEGLSFLFDRILDSSKKP